jgi:hypothetical protein
MVVLQRRRFLMIEVTLYPEASLPHAVDPQPSTPRPPRSITKICIDATSPPPIDATYRGTSLIRNSAPLGPYSRTMPRALWWSYGGGADSY